MRYLIASEGKEWSSPISKRFGHAAYHLVVESDPLTLVEAELSEHDLPGHGLDRFTHLALDGVITGNLGPEAFNDVISRGLKAYIIRGKTVEEAIAMVLAGEVEPADKPSMKRSLHEGHGGGHGHGEGHGHGGGHHHH